MAINITRYDPFRDLARLDPMLDFGWPRMRGLFAPRDAEPAMKLDVTEDAKAYHVKAELPGVKKEDIEVQVTGNVVSLAAETKHEKEEKQGETLLHAERYYGRQYRSFTLAQDIDRSRVEATFQDGVLNLTLPKAASASVQKIAVK